MLQVKVLTIDDLHYEYCRTDVLIFPLIFNELDDGLIFFRIEVASGFISFAGDVHESSVLIAADEVYVVVVLEEGVGYFGYLGGSPHGMDVLLYGAVPYLLTTVLARLQRQVHLLFHLIVSQGLYGGQQRIF